jgi:hypothetical protein
MSVDIIVHRKTEKVFIDLKMHPIWVRAGLEDALHEVGKLVNDETKRLITVGPKTGRWYNIPPYGRHRASAPHEAPANLSGKLRESNDYIVHNYDRLQVGESVLYAEYLEHGVKGRMAPRPHLLKAVNNKHRDTVRAIERHVARRTGVTL